MDRPADESGWSSWHLMNGGFRVGCVKRTGANHTRGAFHAPYKATKNRDGRPRRAVAAGFGQVKSPLGKGRRRVMAL